MKQKLTKNNNLTENNNPITLEANSIFSWNKKQWKPNKIVFIMIYTFVYILVFPKYALIFQTLQEFGNFCHFREVFFNFLSTVVEWTSLLVFQRIRTNMHTSSYFAEKFFPKFDWRFQILPKFGQFFIIIFCNFL